MHTQAIHDLAIDLGRMLAKSLGLASDLFEGWSRHLRINKYNFTPQTVGSTALRMHTDSGFLTILQDDENVSGLEFMDKSGAFVSIDPWPGTLVVNLGDIAKVWSNGRFCSVKHRVQCKEATHVSLSLLPMKIIGNSEFPSICTLVKPSNLYAPIHNLLACHVYPQPLDVCSSPNCDDL